MRERERNEKIIENQRDDQLCDMIWMSRFTFACLLEFFNNRLVWLIWKRQPQNEITLLFLRSARRWCDSFGSQWILFIYIFISREFWAEFNEDFLNEARLINNLFSLIIHCAWLSRTIRLFIVVELKCKTMTSMIIVQWYFQNSSLSTESQHNLIKFK